MRPILALLLMVPLATAGLTARQGTAADETPSVLDDPCTAKCQEGADQQLVASGCQDDESICLCDNQAYISWIETCLTNNCPAEKVAAMKAEIKETCGLIKEYLSTAVDPSFTSTSSARATGIAGVVSSVASLTSTVTLGSPTTRPSASASATGSGIAALPSAASSISSAVSSARNAASSSSAWAMPTAIPGVMGVMAVAAGALLA